MKLIISAALLLANLRFVNAAETHPQKVTFRTEDGWTLTADYMKPGQGKDVVVMFHGLGSTRAEWEKLEKALAPDKIGYLAVDFRGHGESLVGPKGQQDYTTFETDQDWKKLAKDVEAAALFLKKKGVREQRIILAGASIGANLCLNAGVSRKMKIKALLLLSPGVNYHGVTTPEALTKTGNTPVLVMAAQSDNYAYLSAQTLKRIYEEDGKRKLAFIEGPEGHGVAMFNGDSEEKAETLGKLAAWIKNPHTGR